jgi:hypothetical protein
MATAGFSPDAASRRLDEVVVESRSRARAQALPVYEEAHRSLGVTTV